MPEAGATDLLHAKKAGVWRGWQAGPCLGTLTLIQRGIHGAKNTWAPGSQASLSILHVQVTLPIAKAGWAMGQSQAYHQDGSVELGAGQTWAQSPLCKRVLAGWPGAGSPSMSLTFLICEVGEQSPCQWGPVRK